MARNFVAFAVLALAGAALLAEPAIAAGGARGLPGGGFRAPFIQHSPRAGLMYGRRHVAPRAVYGAQPIRPFVPRHIGRGKIAPSPHGFATTTPLRPFAHLARRHHRVYHAGWSFPVVTAGDNPGFIGTPYDPAELIPVYGPAPEAEETEAPARQPVPRLSANRDENADACRSEKVSVPASEGEREITVVRC